jgi:aldehyde:ferredoxin oxidoreductase
MARVFNLREGLTAADDQLPKRFFSSASGGAANASAVDPDAFHRAKRTFYVLMGWDPVTGVPMQEKLEELGIGWARAQQAEVHS